MKRKVGIVVFTHGSRRTEGNETLVRFVAQLRGRLDSDQIEPAFMELGKPLIPTAIKRLVARGCNHIYGWAFFLVPGAHLGEDVPFIFEQTLKKYHGVTWEISPPMLDDPAMLDHVAGRLRQLVEN